MMFADTGRVLETARPGLRGTCPSCHAAVLAKCGPIVTPHWAHVASEDCDRWAEPETEWHRGWKIALAAFGAHVEAPIGSHRADAVTHRGVIELQHSPIPLEEAREREEFYGDMLWLFDMRDTERWERVHFGARGFWWKHGSRTQAALRRPIFWQTPDHSVIQVRLNAVTTERGTRVLGRVIAEFTVEEFLASVTAPRAA